VDYGSNILSQINVAGNCNAYKSLVSDDASDPEYLATCSRPVPSEPVANRYIEYAPVLCMVLKDAAQRVCEITDQPTDLKQNFNAGNFCVVMSETLSELLHEEAQWVSFLRETFKNSTNCKQACIQYDLLNPICKFILKAYMFTKEMQKPSTTNAGEFCLNFDYLLGWKNL
jgi:hypothetical protein